MLLAEVSTDPVQSSVCQWNVGEACMLCCSCFSAVSVVNAVLSDECFLCSTASAFAEISAALLVSPCRSPAEADLGSLCSSSTSSALGPHGAPGCRFHPWSAAEIPGCVFHGHDEAEMLSHWTHHSLTGEVGPGWAGAQWEGCLYSGSLLQMRGCAQPLWLWAVQGAGFFSVRSAQQQS